MREGRRRQIARSERILAMIDEAQSHRYDGDGMNPYELPIVVACRRIYASTVLQLPLVTLRDRRPLPKQPPVVTRPDPFEPRWLSMQRVVDNMTLHGKVWIQPTAWDATGWPSAVRIIDGPQGAPTFDATTGDLLEVSINGQRLKPGPDGVVWLPYEVPARGHPGQAPLAVCWRACEYLAALFDMAGSYWEAGFPSIALMVMQRLSPDDAKTLKAQLRTAWARRHEPAVLDNGATMAPVGSSAVESQLVESIASANAEITRAFGVMPSLVNVAGSDSLTYSTTEGEFQKWLAVGLGPFLTKIEAAWNDLTPYGQKNRFDTSELTRADFATRVAAYSTALGGEAWMDADEVRDREGMAPMSESQRERRAPLAADPDFVGTMQ